MRNTTRALFLAAFLVGPGALSAQSASVTASANVLAQLLVANEADLEFGDVLPGVQYVVEAGHANAGRLRIEGVQNREVTLDFNLPTELSGPAALAISFDDASAGVGATSDGASAVTFDPTGQNTTTLSGASGELYVFIGGILSPTPTQALGTYTGTITLNVAYTGN